MWEYLPRGITDVVIKYYNEYNLCETRMYWIELYRPNVVTIRSKKLYIYYRQNILAREFYKYVCNYNIFNYNRSEYISFSNYILRIMGKYKNIILTEEQNNSKLYYSIEGIRWKPKIFFNYSLKKYI